ncbi:MAG TPA: hypothetical protein PK513_08090 [Alphaproteobacteria bacterium]|nr:hypothetical protein [Alphaproteobacteria bacterium]USO05844.1 MAG: hypothetical protein H6859_01165 [Rhodospirillales bacterium]HOO82446.1 hypothetical protein [Alphaproteobacteria bacterium]
MTDEVKVKVAVNRDWQEVQETAERRRDGWWVKSRRTASGKPVFPSRESGTDSMNFTRAPGE